MYLPTHELSIYKTVNMLGGNTDQPTFKSDLKINKHSTNKKLYLVCELLFGLKKYYAQLTREFVENK